jgi:beta-glucanase (GH16 family)
MKRKMKLRLLGCCFLALFPPGLFGQIPWNDANWQLIPSRSDEFNGSSLDLTKWRFGVGSMNSHFAGKAPNCTCELQFYKPENVVFTGSSVKLVAKHEQTIQGVIMPWLPCTAVLCDPILNCRNFNYTSGAFTSKNDGTGTPLDLAYGYGYFEIEAKIPKGLGFWPAFWLNRYKSCSNGAEIDILEPSGGSSVTANSFGANVWYAADPDCNFNDGGALMSGFPDLSLSFHKYAIDWSPGKVDFYFDNSIIREVLTSLVPDHPMDLYFNLAISNYEPPDINTIFPNAFEINYFHYYNKVYGPCSAEVTDQSNINFNTFNYSDKKSIRIYNSKVPSSGSITLRANDFIEFPYSFEVPVGVTFNAITIKCK